MDPTLRIDSERMFRVPDMSTHARILTLLVIAAHAVSVDAADKTDSSAHWSLIAPRRPSVPQLESSSWAKNAIDRFVLDRLNREGLGPSPSADKRTLIRRVSLDLTGLPPTIDEVDAFVADHRPDAYERLVDRLLASPRYGERMATYWLDAARYSDTFGYHEDWGRVMWPWRDWVIDAFNGNMPFDQFTIEQLAGDLLPDATERQRLATGFHRLHGLTSSGIDEEYRVESVIDRVKTTATIWMGLTIGCAQCHDHKYDPISQEEFYRFFAFFNRGSDAAQMPNKPGNVPPLLRVEPPGTRQTTRRIEQRIATLESLLAKRLSNVDDEIAAWEKETGTRDSRTDEPLKGLILHCSLDEVAGTAVANTAKDGVRGSVRGSVRGNAKWTGGKLGGALEFDGSTWVDLGNAFDFERGDQFSYGAWVYPHGQASGALLSRMDDSASYRGVDVFATGGQIEVHIIHRWPDNALHRKAVAKLPPEKWTHVFVTYDGSSRAEGIRIYIDGLVQEAPITRNRLTDTIRTKTPAHIGRRNPSGFFRGRLDDVRVYDRDLPAADVARLAGSNPVGSILAKPKDSRTEEETRRLKTYYLESRDRTFTQQTREKSALEAKVRKLPESFPTAMVMDEMQKPRDSFFLERGRYDQRGHKVTPGTPASLPPFLDGAPKNRLGLARWLVDPSHPLTSRVIANQLWQLVFGNGLVKSTEDLGTQGERPSHPELLDWLAVEIVESGWDIKASLRRMVTSSTYRQSSASSRAAFAYDPDNRLLARGSRQRLSAEMIRDSALAISGLLVEKMGGPSVKPYQPPGLWKEMRNQTYVQDHGEKLYRRSVYVFRRRSVPPPNLSTFDSPDRETACVRRQRTNTPLMALVLMNDPTFVEAARTFAQRVLTDRELDDAPVKERIAYAFRLATARPPSLPESDILEDVYRMQLEAYRSDQAAASKLLAVGESKRNETLDAIEHAALTTVMSLILNMDETLTRE
jgi:hypothetical protein